MKRKLIGRVGVDSGQLLIMDPCYMEKYWKKDSESDIKGVKFWGAGKQGAVQYLQTMGYEVEVTENHNAFIQTTEKQEVEAINQILADYLHKDIDGNRIVWDTVNTGSYQEICDLTLNGEKAGEYKNIIGCAFQSGFGDGLYDVYATYKDYGFGNMVDKRISKVEIILIED